MTGAHLHLLLNHVPILGSVFGLAVLAVGLVRRREELLRTGWVALLVAALAAIPTYLSGEPAEHIVEELAGVSHAAIEAHEEAALLALIAMEALGLLALVALVMGRGSRPAPRWAAGGSLLLAIVAAGLMAWTGSLGGEIHHPEIRSGPAAGEVEGVKP